MQAILSLSRAALVVAAGTLTLHAQCFDTNTGASLGVGDDTIFAAQPLGFAFPFNGTTYTFVHPCTNGFLYLSNGTTTGGSGCCTGSIATMTASPSPMIAAYWSDLNVLAANSGAVRFNASPTKAVITWENAAEYVNTGLFTFQIQLSATGEINFVYQPSVAVYGGHVFLAGMSPGSGAIAGAATDFSIGGVGATNTNYQLFGPTVGPVSVAGLAVHFVPTVPGFVWVSGPLATNCATNTGYGTGCYNFPSLFYQSFADAVAANAALQGNALLLALSGSSYMPAWVPGGAGAFYVAPTGAAVAMAQDDDGDTPVALPLPLPIPGGTTTNLVVSHNGIITIGVTGNNSFDYTPTGPEMAAATGAAFYTGWHDWDDFDSVGTGRIKTELVGSTFYITWDNVENYPVGVVNPGTMQIQLNLASGLVTYVWTVIDPSTASVFGTAYVVGYKAPGAQADPGSINLATGLPVSVPNVPLQPLSLSAGPTPISTPSTGTVVTYTTSNIPPFVPGLYIAINIMSVGQVPAPGLDLGFLGAPGCPALVQSLDLTQAMVGATSTQSVTFAIPAGVPAGVQLFSQSAALITPNSLPNGQNAAGLTTSNGIASTIQPQ
jgi:hypothetical protein